MSKTPARASEAQDDQKAPETIIGDNSDVTVESYVPVVVSEYQTDNGSVVGSY